MRRALTPFGSRAATPASLGLRFIAGGIDAAIFQFFVFMPLWLTTFDLSGGMNRPETMAITSPSQVIFSIMLLVLYLSVPEGRWGASLSKAICQIRVVGLQGSRLGIPRAAVRTLVCHLFLTAPALVYSYVSTDGTMAMTADSSLGTKLMSVSSLVMVAILFCMARRSNGFAGLHDLATGARVIGKHAFQKRPKVDALDETMPEFDSAPLIGPYHALGSFDAAATGAIIPGFDLKLRRRVWIRKAGEGSSMLSREERSRNRIGRIRWINGSRAPGRCWDAYEALSGRPLATMLSTPQSWTNVRYWMLDLLTEFRAAAADASLPETIGADRIGITEDGRAKLLHFAAPGVSEDEALTTAIPTISGADLQPGPFVKAVADAALAGRRSKSGRLESATPPPLHARTLIEGIANVADDEALVELQAATERRANVSVYRRLGLVFFSAAPALFACAALAIGVYAMVALQSGKASNLEPLSHSLMRLRNLQNETPPATGWKRKHIEAFRVYIPGQFRDTMSNSNEWNGVYATALVYGDLRELANELVAIEPRPSSSEIEAAKKTLVNYLKKRDADIEKRRSGFIENLPEFGLMFSSAALLVLTIIPGLIAALAFRGGLLLRLLGLAFVTRTGEAAPRWRVFVRNFIMWAPIAVLPVLYNGFLDSKWPLVYIVVYGVVFLVSLISPARGLQDRIAGTYLVPR